MRRRVASASWVIALLAILCLACSSLSAQNLTGAISGTVTDPSQAVVPQATVTIVNADTHVVAWRGTTNESGVYRAPELPVGRYDLSVEMAGFKRATMNLINVTVDQRVAADIRLETGAVTEAVTIQDTVATQLATESSSLGNVLTNSQVANLPLPSRNILNLLSLIPGVSSGGDATGINANQLSINGSRTLNSEFTVDGISVVSGSTGGVQSLPPSDAIREVKVLTSAYSAEYGRTSGGTVTMIVNSGGSAYHGGLYEYFRNEDLNANNFFNNVRGQARPEDRYNLFGGKLGGPIRIPKLYNGKDKTFFFFNYEGLRQISPYANISSVPSDAFRTGNFSASPIVVDQPGTTTPFPNNTIPSNLINSAAAKILGVLPTANSSGTIDAANGRNVNDLVEAGSTKPANDTETARVDHNFSDRWRLSGTFTHYHNLSPMQPIIPGPLENAVGNSVTTGFQAISSLTATLSPTLVFEARMGFWRNNAEVVPPSLGIDVQQTYGIATNTAPVSPQFNISGWSQYGLNSNTLRSQIDNNYQPSFSLTKVWGNHLIKVGYELRKNEFNIYNPGGGAFEGSYSFTGDITSVGHISGNAVNALADFLLGYVKTGSYTLPQPMAGRRNSNTGVYAQDDWKIARNLTLNLGIRYEYEGPLTSSNGIYSRVDPASGQVLFPGINASRSLNLSSSKVNFAPRVGLAYSIDPKTVFRSGFGVFYSQFFSDLGAQVLFPGFTISQSFNNLGTGVAQSFSLNQGLPLIAVQNLNAPQTTLGQYSPTNPLAPSAQFAQMNPMPYAAEWNAGVQRQLWRAILLDVNYAGSSGVNLPINLPYNLVPYALGTQLAYTNTSAVTQAARPFPSVNGFSALTMAGHSSYQALQVSARRQYTERLSFVASFNWSKAMSDGDGLYTFSQPSGVNVGQFPTLFRNLDRAVTEFDRPRTLTAAIQYRTAGPKWLRNIEIDPILTARDGLPLTINQNTFNPAASQLRPSVISNTSIYLPNEVPNGTGIQYLVPATAANFPLAPVGPMWVGTGSARTLLVPAGIGTLGRDTVRAPGDIDLDIAASRIFPIRERMNLTVRAEAFNSLNHTNLLSPNTSLSATSNASNQVYWNSPSFGLITGARSARFMQLVLRFTF